MIVSFQLTFLSIIGFPGLLDTKTYFGSVRVKWVYTTLLNVIIQTYVIRPPTVSSFLYVPR